MNSFSPGSVSSCIPQLWQVLTGFGFPFQVFVCGCIQACGLYYIVCLSLHQNCEGDEGGNRMGSKRTIKKQKKVQRKLNMHFIFNSNLGTIVYFLSRNVKKKSVF